MKYDQVNCCYKAIFSKYLITAKYNYLSAIKLWKGMQMIKQAKLAAMLINGIEENNSVPSFFNQYYPFFNIYEQCLSKALPVSKCNPTDT